MLLLFFLLIFIYFVFVLSWEKLMRLFCLYSSFPYILLQRRRKRILLSLLSMWDKSWPSKSDIWPLCRLCCTHCVLDIVTAQNSQLLYLLCRPRFVWFTPTWWCPLIVSPSELWACPSQTIHLKTASWPWLRASWSCQSTPVCWSLPGSSGGWGELIKCSRWMHPSEGAK